MKTICTDDVISFHDWIIAHLGGAPGVLNRHMLESALARPHASFGGVELFPTLFQKVAALAHAIATGHPFVDGNKRTAAVAAAVLLYLNGYDLEVGGAGLERVMVALAEHQLSLEEFADWLADHARPVEGDLCTDLG